MKAEAQGLSPRQMVAVAALLSNTREEAARCARVTARTLYRWMQAPGFRAELARQRSRVVADALTTLAAGVEDAATTLRAIAKNNRAPAASRVTACRAILDFAAGYDERSSLLARLEDLERGLRDANLSASYRRPS
jgi:hypothetical protein